MKNMLWKRYSFWLHKCEICSKRTFIQHEVGIGGWVCGTPQCDREASKQAYEDLVAWIKDGNRKNIIRTCRFVDVIDLVPVNWDWFFGAISENAPFSWGDNNRTMITKDRFLSHVEPIVMDAETDGDITKQERENFIRKIEQLAPDVYIDLEN